MQVNGSPHKAIECVCVNVCMYACVCATERKRDRVCEAENLALNYSHFSWLRYKIPGSWGCRTTRGRVKKESLIRDWQAVANVWSFR